LIIAWYYLNAGCEDALHVENVGLVDADWVWHQTSFHVSLQSQEK